MDKDASAPRPGGAASVSQLWTFEDDSAVTRAQRCFRGNTGPPVRPENGCDQRFLTPARAISRWRTEDRRLVPIGPRVAAIGPLVKLELVVVGLSAERAATEIQIRDDMIRVAHRAGASLRQLAAARG